MLNTIWIHLNPSKSIILILCKSHKIHNTKCLPHLPRTPPAPRTAAASAIPVAPAQPSRAASFRAQRKGPLRWLSPRRAAGSVRPWDMEGVTRCTQQIQCQVFWGWLYLNVSCLNVFWMLFECYDHHDVSHVSHVSRGSYFKKTGIFSAWMIHDDPWSGR